MSDEIAALREEILRLRSELDTLRGEHRRVLKLLGIRPLPPDGKWPELLSIDAECIGLRSTPTWIPVIMRADEKGARIELLDKESRVRASLAIGSDDAWFELYNAERKHIVGVREAADGSGQMFVGSKTGQPRAGLRVNEFGGLVTVVDEKGRPQAALFGKSDGGEVFVVNALQQMGAVMVATVQGGIVRVQEPGGQVMGFLSANTEAGALVVHGPQGSMAAAVTSAEDGGKVVLFNVDGELTSALP